MQGPLNVNCPLLVQELQQGRELITVNYSVLLEYMINFSYDLLNIW